MPSYPWTCGACSASNAAGQEDCTTCRCPSNSSLQTQEKYRAAHEGNGPPVEPASPKPGKAPPANTRKPGRSWLYASFFCLAAAILSLILLLGDAPFLPVPGSRMGSWDLPDEAMFACILVFFLATPVALVCGVLALRTGGHRRATKILLWLGMLFVVPLWLVCCA